MKLKSILAVALFLATLISTAQEKLKFRFGINSTYNACNYGAWGEETHNAYYSFKKIPLTGLDDLRGTLRSGTLGATTTFHFSLEKRLKNENNIIVGIMLNDNAGYGYELHGSSEIFTYGLPPSKYKMAGNNYLGGLYGSINTRRYFIAIERPISSFLCKCNTKEKINKKINIRTDIHLGFNIIEKRPTSGSFGDWSVILVTGDTLTISNENSNGYSRNFGFTLEGGLSFKFKNIKEKELFCINLTYEQGFINLGGNQTNIYVKNYHFVENVYTRGSRLNLMISRAFNLPDLKKKRAKSKINTPEVSF